MSGSLLLRADASFGIGTGHVMRLIALATAWLQGEEIGANDSAILLGCVTIPRLRKRLAQEGIGVWNLMTSYPDSGDFSALSNLAEVFQPAWIVLDGYHFDSAYQAAVRTLGIPVLMLDDMAHHDQYHADLLLNQNVGAEDFHYNADPDTDILIGPRYCLLRPELRAARTSLIENWDKLENRPSPTRRLLITMGGADHRGLSFLALKAFSQLGPGWEAKIIMGSASRRLSELRQQAANLAGIEIHADVRDMGPLMAWADMAISTAGTTTWELAYLGIPTLLVVAADNQILVAQSAHAAGCAVNLGWWEDLTVTKLVNALEELAADENQRRTMRIAGQILVDGEGTNRVVQAMLDRKNSRPLFNWENSC